MTKKQSAPERTILALDLGHKTGWCLGRKEYGTWESPGENIGEQLRQFMLWLSGKVVDADKYFRCELPATSIDLVVYERPHLRGWAASFSLVGRAAVVEMIRSNSKCSSVHSATIKKFITGSGRATKEDVIAAVKKRGFKPKDDNAADAIALWLYAQENL
jgi:crossover junction endodeoxyribonuclease RuvC